jgi:hypothetical protein
MGRTYTVPLSFTYTAAGGDFDAVYLAPASNKPIKLLGFSLGQISEVGDAAEEGVRVSIIRLPATVTASSGGSSITATPIDSADSAAGFTARAGDSTVATTSGTAVTLAEYGWNERATPFTEWFPPGREPKAKNAEALVIRLQTTLADDATVQATAWVEEE